MAVVAAFLTAATVGLTTLPTKTHAQATLPAEVRDLQQLPTSQLRQMRKNFRKIANNRSFSDQQRQHAARELARINLVLSARARGQNQPPKPPRAGAHPLTVLHDRRPSSALSTSQLRQRLRRLEQVIDARGVKKKFKRQARSMRAADQAELRRRKAANPNPPVQGARFAVLNDRRPPTSLNRRQLRRRIDALSAVISSPRANNRQRSTAFNRRSQDRAELRRRGGGGVAPPSIPQNPVTDVLNDRRPPHRLTDTQLLRRLARLERLIDSRGVSSGLKARARAMRRRDRAEMDRRRSGISQPPVVNPPVGNVDTRVLDDRRPPHLLNDTQLLSRLTRLERIIDARGVPQYLKARARQMRFAAQAELDRRRGANAGPPVDDSVLDDRRSAQSLSNRALRNRLDRANRLANNRRAQPHTRRAARRLYQSDLAEWNRRQQANQPPPNNGLAVLNDRRPARSLTTPQLRRRVASLRRALRIPGLTGDERRRLSRRLGIDRTVLRERIARQFNPPSTVNPGPPASNRGDLQATARRLLRDYRQPAALSNPQLRRRIRDARQVLLFVSLQSFERRHVSDLIRKDRAEKRRRLLQARQVRQSELARLRARGRLQFRTPPPQYLPQGDLNAAEFDRDTITRKFLTAPPPAARRYTLNEIRRSPQLTRRYPGVDLDTVNFGFNESFIREEEIDELERMALAIERILAVRPYEIFQIAGHTDAVGSVEYNKGLSEQRARAVRDALTQFFVIPERNLITVGFGEAYLKIPTEAAEAENRRVTIRRITPLLR